MADFLTGFLSSALLCSLGIFSEKFCNTKEEVKESTPEYIMMSKNQYEYMKNNPDVKKIIIEQPQMPPLYSEKDNALILMKSHKGAF